MTVKPHRILGAIVWVTISATVATPSLAFKAGTRTTPAQGTLDAAFAPWEDVEGLIVEAIGKARRQVLVQAYIFTSMPMTAALVAARKRGVDVRLLVDAGQLTKTGRDRIAALQAAGARVKQETAYKNAHNKVIIIDATGADATVMTGSYNFTWTAQHKNAENIVIARRNPVLAARYADNWARHDAAAEVYIPSK